MSRCWIVLLSPLLLIGVARAEVTQSFTAVFGEVAFESGDDEINLIPIGSSFNLSASTRGAAGWPPPKTPIDRFSIVCDGFREGQTLLLEQASFSRSTCSVTLEKGRSAGGAADASYVLDTSYAGNRFEITRAQGKVYEGRFSFRLKDAAGQLLEVSDGRFLVEDRQL